MPDAAEERDASPDEGPLSAYPRLVSRDRDVLVLSVAMFAFSLAFQMTTRYLPEYMATLGAGSVVIGVFGTVQNVLSAAYPYPGGVLSDRIGSRRALTGFAILSTLGFAVWLVAPGLALPLGPWTVEPWVWIFVGLILAQAWKSLGLGATFAVVKQAVDPGRLAAGFASTETFRRLAFLVGPLLAAGALYLVSPFTVGFQVVLGVAVAFGLAGTLAQHLLYEADRDRLGKRFEGLSQLVDDLRELPPELRGLLAGDTVVRFANGMVYVFFVIVVTRFLEVELAVAGLRLGPEVLFGLFLGLEMVVALLTMAPAARLAERVGLKPVVATGFAVYAVFPALLISAPSNAWVVAGLFAFSGLRFAGLPAHKALIVGPAREKAGGRVTGAYYLVRNVVVAPSAALGGWLYARDPTLAFTAATAVGLVGLALFLAWGREFDAYEA